MVPNRTPKRTSKRVRKKKDTQNPKRFSAFFRCPKHFRVVRASSSLFPRLFWDSLALSGPAKNEKKKTENLSVKNGLNRTISKGSNYVLGTISLLFTMCEHWFRRDRVQENQLLKEDLPMRAGSFSTVGFLAARPFENRKTEEWVLNVAWVARWE